jgi:hypothetical protein
MPRSRTVTTEHPSSSAWLNPARPAGVEVLLPSCANACDVSRPGLVDAPPPSGYPPQTLARGANCLQPPPRARCITRVGRPDRRRRRSVVAPQQSWSQQSPHGQILRRAWLPTTLMTSSSRTAGCGPACPVVWEGLRRQWLTPIPINFQLATGNVSGQVDQSVDD